MNLTEGYRQAYVNNIQSPQEVPQHVHLMPPHITDMNNHQRRLMVRADTISRHQTSAKIFETDDKPLILTCEPNVYNVIHSVVSSDTKTTLAICKHKFDNADILTLTINDVPLSVQINITTGESKEVEILRCYDVLTAAHDVTGDGDILGEFFNVLGCADVGFSWLTEWEKLATRVIPFKTGDVKLVFNTKYSNVTSPLISDDKFYLPLTVTQAVNEPYLVLKTLASLEDCRVVYQGKDITEYVYSRCSVDSDLTYIDILKELGVAKSEWLDACVQLVK